MRKFRTPKGSKAKTRKSPSRSSRNRKPFGLGYGITGVSLVTILTMTYFNSVAQDTVAQDIVVAKVEKSEDAPKVEKVTKVEDAPKVDLNSMTKAQLLEHAAKVGIKVYKSWNKTKMIETLSA